jgi:CBS domain-containing protein
MEPTLAQSAKQDHHGRIGYQGWEGEMKVSQILDSKGGTVITISPEASVRQAVNLMHDNRIGALVVSTDGQHIEGIFSERDLVALIAEIGPDVLQRTVGEFMTMQVTCTGPDELVDDLMAQMTDRRIRHLPVVNDDRVLIGLVSIGDAVKSRLGELEGEREALIGYITTGG